MTQEEVIELARQAGYQHPDAVGQCEDFAYFDLEAFAKLVAEKEREACAKLVESFQRDHIYTADMAGLVGAVKHKLADAIRAKGNV